MGMGGLLITRVTCLPTPPGIVQSRYICINQSITAAGTTLDCLVSTDQRFVWELVIKNSQQFPALEEKNVLTVAEG